MKQKRFSEEFLQNNHQKCLELLDKFIEICEKNRIDYYLTEGSALGAVRHKGFIPWDIHIDIHLDIANFLKLDKVMMSENLGNLAWFRPASRICPLFMFKNQTTKRKDFDIVQAPDLDITIMGKAPNNRIIRWIVMNILFLNIKMFKLKNTAVKRHFPYNILRYVSMMLPDSIYFSCLNLFMRKNQEKQAEYYMALTPSFYGNSELIKTEWIGTEPFYGEFDGRKVRLFKNYHDYLTNRYGDYMKPVVWETKGEYGGCFYEHKTEKSGK